MTMIENLSEFQPKNEMRNQANNNSSFGAIQKVREGVKSSKSRHCLFK